MKMICVRLPDDVAQEFKVEARKNGESAQQILGGSAYSYIGKEYPKDGLPKEADQLPARKKTKKAAPPKKKAPTKRK